MTPATAAAMGAVAVDKAGVGSAVLNSSRQVGGSLGRIRMPILFALAGLLAQSGLLRGWRRGSARVRLVSNYYLYAVWVVLYAVFFALLARPDFPHSIDSLDRVLLAVLEPRPIRKPAADDAVGADQGAAGAAIAGIHAADV